MTSRSGLRVYARRGMADSGMNVRIWNRGFSSTASGVSEKSGEGCGQPQIESMTSSTALYTVSSLSSSRRARYASNWLRRTCCSAPSSLSWQARAWRDDRGLGVAVAAASNRCCKSASMRQSIGVQPPHGGSGLGGPPQFTAWLDQDRVGTGSGQGQSSVEELSMGGRHHREAPPPPLPG